MEEEMTYNDGYACCLCNYVGDKLTHAVDHVDGKSDETHSDVLEAEAVIEERRRTVTRETLEAVYVISKRAKKWADKATHLYGHGRKAEARAASERKESLYGAKSEFLSKAQHTAARIESHLIGGSDFYCLYFFDDTGTRWSFHVPYDSIRIDRQIDKTAELDDFESDAAIERTSMGIEAALTHLYEEHGVSANDHVPLSPMHTDWTATFTGWDCLD